MKNLICIMTLLLTTMSFSQVYQFQKVFYGEDYEVIFNKVSENIEQAPNTAKGKDFYYVKSLSDKLENYIVQNLDSSNFSKYSNDEIYDSSTDEEKLESIALTWSKIDYRDKFLLVNYNDSSKMCDTCYFEITKELIDYDLDQVKRIKNISDLRVYTIFSSKKGILSLFGVKRVNVNTIIIVQTTEKYTRENGYTFVYDNYPPIYNYETLGFQPGRMIVWAILWPFRALSK